MSQTQRYLTVEDRYAFTPVHVVWEITLACNLKCQHCGSRAGRRRSQELTTSECLDLVGQLAKLGARHITLIGGEAYLRKDWIEIIRAIRSEGMDCTLQTGGMHLNSELLRRAVSAGLQGVGVSIDGLAEVHDKLRGVKGSFEAAFATLERARAQGLSTSANTQITTLVISQLPELMQRLIEAGVEHWQVQLTVAMGRAADNPELLLQPYELLELMPLLAKLYKKGLSCGLLMQPGNNIGYFGPYEALWRGSGDDRVHWLSCNAGQNTMGIEADGTIKGCPSLPTADYAGGNVRNTPLEAIWRRSPEVAFTRSRTVNDLWGFCRSCYYSDVCQAGCTWTTHVLFGRAGNNPYCHHRALELARQGLRERLVRITPAPGQPFDYGLFEIVLETLEGESIANASAGTGSNVTTAEPKPAPALVQIQPSPKKTHPVSTVLELCRGCNRYVVPKTLVCPHCGGDIRSLAKAYKMKLRKARLASKRLLSLLGSEAISSSDSK